MHLVLVVPDQEVDPPFILAHLAPSWYHCPRQSKGSSYTSIFRAHDNYPYTAVFLTASTLERERVGRARGKEVRQGRSEARQGKVSQGGTLPAREEIPIGKVPHGVLRGAVRSTS